MRSLILILTALLIPQIASAQSREKTHPVQSAVENDGDGQSSSRSIRVLTIGNSFAGNACKYLKEIAADGHVDLVIGTANLGGCTLERHATLARKSAGDSTNQPYSDRSQAGKTKGSSKLSLQEYLAVQSWDFVTLQQMSALSHKSESYHPHIDELVALIREHAPQAKILIHQTWAYRPDSPLLKQWKITQQEMHDGLVKAYGDVASQFEATLIPVGNAFHAVRLTPGREVVVPDPNFDFANPVYPTRPDQQNSLVTGWHWSKRDGRHSLGLDFKHANVAGCYLAGLVWYEVITGNNAQGIQYTPNGINAADATFLRGVAHDVVRAPVATAK